MREQEVSVQKEQKDVNEIKYVMQIIELGQDYWLKLLALGIQHNALGYADQNWLRQAADFAVRAVIPQNNSTGKVPLKTMTLARSAFAVRDKLESLGITVQ